MGEAGGGVKVEVAGAVFSEMQCLGPKAQRRQPKPPPARHHLHPW